MWSTTWTATRSEAIFPHDVAIQLAESSGRSSLPSAVVRPASAAARTSGARIALGFPAEAANVPICRRGQDAKEETRDN
jgi:hypothetical protein